MLKNGDRVILIRIEEAPMDGLIGLLHQRLISAQMNKEVFEVTDTSQYEYYTICSSINDDVLPFISGYYLKRV